MMKRKKNKGFTLIELLVVLAIIGILASVGVVAYNGYTESAKKGASKSNHNSVKKWIQNELQKCSIGEAKAMPDKDKTKQLACTDAGDAAKVITAVVASIGGQDDFKNPWDTTQNAVVSGTVASGACTKTNDGFSHLSKSGTEILIFTCTAAKESADEKNELSTKVPVN